jgi:DNA invertase Pin-like site-specific DNA recombinase
MKTIAYLRVSKNTQEVKNQRLAILEFAQAEKFSVDEFMELSMSSRRSSKERQIDILLAKLHAGDLLIVSELSRMGRSVGEIIATVDTLIKQSVKLIAIKEGIRLNGKHDLQSKIMITLVGLFAEIERDLISVRTKEGLAAARAAGKLLGRPKGKLGNSKLDGREDEIGRLLSLKVSKASIAKITAVDRATLCHFITTRKIAPLDSVGVYGA